MLKDTVRGEPFDSRSSFDKLRTNGDFSNLLGKLPVRLATLIFGGAIATASACGVDATSQSPWPPALDRLLPSTIEPVYSALGARFDAAAALDTVVFMDRYWRVAASAGFLQSQDRIRQHLVAAGFDGAADPAAAVRATARTWFEEFADPEVHGWDHTRGTLSIVEADGADEEVLSRERHRVALCINSFPTPPGGLRALLVDVGPGATDAAYAGREVRGAVVIGDAPVQRLWAEAVRKRGALGVISTEFSGAIVRRSPEVDANETLDVLQWDSIPFDEQLKSFAFKATPRAAGRLRERLRQGQVQVRVQIESSFSEAPDRTLVAEIPGATRPQERIVMVAHVQEPGANDNASGCATLEALALALHGAIRDGVIPRPARTLTFLWVDEMRGSRQWLKDHASDVAGIQYMFSLDMTGEDTSKTGGNFLIEKQPDPSAVWQRPSDPHTEWGTSNVEQASLKGSLLNDVHLAICLRRARDTGWVVRTNPYAGGSDHSVFGQAGVPSILDWHFTDRYYHTNLDRPDRTSAPEMMNVGVAVGTSAMLLASADAAAAASVARLVDAAAEARFGLEAQQSAQIISETPTDDVRRREAVVMRAWRKWYGEALESVLRLPVEGADARLKDDVATRVARIAAGSRPD